MRTIRSAVSITVLSLVPFPTANGQQGRIVSTTIESSALAGNIVNDPTTKRARVYLPPSYDTTSKRYPVAYYLHGGGGNYASLFSEWSASRSADASIADGQMEEMILVAVDGVSPFHSSLYINSPVQGNTADYVAQDVVNHIDENFRTISHRDSRAVFGASLGGYGTIRFAMDYSDVFGSVYALSNGCCFSQQGSALNLMGDHAVFPYFGDAVGPLQQAIARGDSKDSGVSKIMFSWATGFSPDPDNPEHFYSDLPFELPSLEVIPEVRDRWLENDLIWRLPDHVDELKSLRGFAMDVGNRDTANIADFRALDQALSDAGVPHQSEIYDGGHSDRRRERIALAMQYFSDVLITAELAGDFNGDRLLDVDDVESLSDDIQDGNVDPRMDLNDDGLVNVDDLTAWVKGEQFGNTYIGDANLDGEFNSGDLVAIFQAGQYEDDIAANSGWSTGDWNGDGEFDAGDLVLAFQDGGFESGPRETIQAVPEPTTRLLILFIPLLLATIRGQGGSH